MTHPLLPHADICMTDSFCLFQFLPSRKDCQQASRQEALGSQLHGGAPADSMQHAESLDTGISAKCPRSPTAAAKATVCGGQRVIGPGHQAMKPSLRA